jgi:exodeoxyribonuclease III
VEQATVLAHRKLDVLALQEVTERTLPMWRAACETLGLGHVLPSLERADPGREPAARRRTGVLIASRTPLDKPSASLPVPWAETALGACVGSPEGSVEVHTVHVPNAANGWVKVRTLEAMRAALADAAPAPRVICGDFNTPRRELPNGETMSFARDSRGRLRPERGLEWDAAELAVVPGLRDLGYRDAFRSLHGYGERSPSWTWEKISGHAGGWRLDHLFCSSELRPVASVYHHDWREDGLSDHSPLEVELERSRRRPRRGVLL